MLALVKSRGYANAAEPTVVRRFQHLIIEINALGRTANVLNARLFRRKIKDILSTTEEEELKEEESVKQETTFYLRATMSSSRPKPRVGSHSMLWCQTAKQPAMEDLTTCSMVVAPRVT